MARIARRIPLTISPMFWLVAALIGYVNSQTWMGTLIWMGIILVSVLFHEFGHALTALLFGRHPRIELVAWGGLTYHEGENLSFPKQFLIVFNGPLFGFILFILATLVLQFVPPSNELMLGAVGTLQWVNLFWTLLNLLPVMPLDGGQLLRIVCEAFWGVRGFKYALLTSMAIAIGMSLFFFLYQAFLVGALFFLLGFQSFETWRKSRQLSEKDRDAELKMMIHEAETLLHAGQKERARETLNKILSRTREGMIYLLSTQYLAYLDYEEGRAKEAYELLLPIQGELSSDALCLLHKAAFDQKDYPLVIELGGRCFQTWPSVETALRNAYACASFSQTNAAIGWLQTALKEGLQNIQEVLSQEAFNPIRQDPAFQSFILNIIKN
ncbi:MAG: M50 family metallopeptidase [Chlamydiales bacterium]|nr:M50 family metallopeptidase [Chlamydiales bacterium]